MDETQKTLMARILDMNDLELRSALLMMVRLSFETNSPPTTKDMLKECIDAAYNNFRREIK